MRKLTLLLIILLLPSLSVAVNDGNTLLLTCSEFIKGVDNPDDSNIDREQMYRCGSYLTGYIAAVSLHQNKLGSKGLICFPNAKMSSPQLGRIVIKYLEKHPESLSLDKDAVTAAAVMEAFPCKKHR